MDALGTHGEPTVWSALAGGHYRGLCPNEGAPTILPQLVGPSSARPASDLVIWLRRPTPQASAPLFRSNPNPARPTELPPHKKSPSGAGPPDGPGRHAGPTRALHRPTLNSANRSRAHAPHHITHSVSGWRHLGRDIRPCPINDAFTAMHTPASTPATSNSWGYSVVGAWLRDHVARSEARSSTSPPAQFPFPKETGAPLLQPRWSRLRSAGWATTMPAPALSPTRTTSMANDAPSPATMSPSRPQPADRTSRPRRPRRRWNQPLRCDPQTK